MNRTPAPPRPSAALAVDDDEANLLLLRRPFAKEGITLHTATSPAAMFEILDSRPVDVILLDWMMPGVTGLEALARVRRDPRWDLVPVIMVTSRGEAEDVRAALEAGASDFIRKPIDRVELMARVKASLRERRLVAGMAQANAKLRGLNKMKDDFLAIVSHDLRSPLATVIGYASRIQDGEEGPLNDRQKRMAAGIGRLARRQLHLIDSLLDVARLNAGAMELSLAPVNLADVVKECVDAMRPEADFKGIELACAAPPLTVTADEGKLLQVANNLVNNALKFTPPEGKVTVTLEQRGEEAVLTVRDTGPGITPEEASRLFEQFQQGAAGMAAAGKGFGLGLSIVRGIVTLHNGRVWVESQPGQGAAFYVALPVEGPEGVSRDS
ncbi:MAG: hybrid sensor histidine kinase/response regulator [Nitrospinae bacterium]|nr:hybrid sensor histidine kinase/response regulator [Nitrospinota bacterium]